MEKKELDILRKLQSGGVDSKYLLDIYEEFKNNYRIKLNLIQHPAFPVDTALNVISSLFTPDILNVTKNKRANPFVRKKCEIEFTQRYNKIPRGEKISLLKRAPLNLIEYFINEKDVNILKVIIDNPNCTEDLIIKFVNRKSDLAKLYNILIETDWIKNRRVWNAISFDKELPIKIWMKIIPNIELKRLKEISEKSSLHEIVKKNINGLLLQKKQ
ncbi:MAG: hypothetical protein KAR14_12855 [Candidatus Aminicenantes bacterium]|nr:hypothetical protein [Candidatus Aminicenantes bacterium]